MDQTSSRDTNSPTVNRVSEKPPFKLCFSKDQLLGKSNVRGSKIDGDPITPKFYSRNYENASDPNTTDTFEEIRNQERKTPRDCCRWPLLTSSMYGWWHEYGIQPKGSQLNFHKKTSDLVNYQMKIYAEDRKLGSLKH
ncbi:uncharacterized protein LOC128884892 isoform X2 [Hylaeus volcanicus]|uniref:uncharacterized protein LOC128884892 isoform X2 n=1 Tax=Hylaeus volcanicus TaxID=313075 RepID=UPI0023B883E9|nr:uncharacterized protein LOC128884892 isoform X2 [Hylaeus volcanicus]